MIITSMQRKPRAFGPNEGIPMLHVEVEEGTKKVEDLVLSTLEKASGLPGVFVGYKVVPGLGLYMEALSKMGLSVELQIVGDVRTPGWLNGPDLVFVDYRETPGFNYYSLRKKDFIVYSVEDREDLDKFRDFSEEHKLTPATKWILVPKDLLDEGFLIVSEHLRCRVSVREENYAHNTANNKMEVAAN